MVPGIEHRTLTARDGTRIGYQVRPGDDPRAPAVVLANGLGGSYLAFKLLYPALDGCRVLCWDYRGLFSTAQPSDRRANTVGHQVDDLEQLLAAEKIDRAVHIGWSMGVQVNFEHYRRHPGRVVALMAINGTYGRPFRTVMSSRFVEKAIPHLLRLVRAQADLVGVATRLVAGSDAMLAAAVRLGLVSASADVELMRELVAQFGTIDWRIYSDLLRRLNEHDAEDLLPRITVPTVIVTADRDIVTPPSTAEHMHRAIAGSRLVTIRGGTHYTPVEFAPILRDEIAQLRARLPGWVAEREARAAASR